MSVHIVEGGGLIVDLVSDIGSRLNVQGCA
jgi:hypothetical protein